MSLGEVNALDRAGFWRIADVALETAFAGRTFDEAIRDAERFTHLGYWSDGRKVIPPLITDDVSSAPPGRPPQRHPPDSLGRAAEAGRFHPDRDRVRGSGESRRPRVDGQAGGSQARVRRTGELLKPAPFPQALKVESSCDILRIAQARHAVAELSSVPSFMIVPARAASRGRPRRL